MELRSIEALAIGLAGAEQELQGALEASEAGASTLEVRHSLDRLVSGAKRTYDACRKTLLDAVEENRRDLDHRAYWGEDRVTHG